MKPEYRYALIKQKWLPKCAESIKMEKCKFKQHIINKKLIRIPKLFIRNPQGVKIVNSKKKKFQSQILQKKR